MYKYFTKHNTYRYINILQKLLEGYNNIVHSTIGMAPRNVNPSNIYAVWQKMRSQSAVIARGRVKFRVGDLVRITKEKLKFAKGYEHTFRQKYLG
jgi:hypothetical protein